MVLFSPDGKARSLLVRDFGHIRTYAPLLAPGVRRRTLADAFVAEHVPDATQQLSFATTMTIPLASV